eukprot:4652285-Pyramimonas_sp.AAC.1
MEATNQAPQPQDEEEEVDPLMEDYLHCTVDPQVRPRAFDSKRGRRSVIAIIFDGVGQIDSFRFETIRNAAVDLSS